MKIQKHLALVTGLVLSFSGITGIAKEFEPDENTTFLIHFNKNLEANFAKGETGVNGNAALTEDNGGRFGEALMVQDGLCVTPAGLQVPYKFLSYNAKNNYDPTRGTIELWVQPTVDFPAIMKEKETENYACTSLVTIMEVDRHGQGAGYFSLQLVYNKYERVKWALSLMEKRKTEDRFYDGEDWVKMNRERFHLDHDISAWQKDSWHHVAVTWDGKNRALFVDGKKVASTTTAKYDGLPADARHILVGGDFNGKNSIRIPSLIDEVRISGIVRYNGTAPEK